VIISWEYEECFKDLRNPSLGKISKICLISLMTKKTQMKKTQITSENTILVLLALIVLKLQLLLVVL
jgi:hypothetical protein